MAVYLTLREAAKEAGVSHTAIAKAIKTGRLTQCLIQVRGRQKIDLEKFRIEWAQQASNRRGPTLYEPVKSVAVEVVGGQTDAMQAAADAGSSYLESRALREAYAARLAKLEYDEKTGELVLAETVKAEAFKVARMVRDAMLNIPDRIAAELAAETNQFKVHALLTSEIKKALSTLSEAE